MEIRKPLFPAQPQSPVCWGPHRRCTGSLTGPREALRMLCDEMEQGQVRPGCLGLQPDSPLGVHQAFPDPGTQIASIGICERRAGLEGKHPQALCRGLAVLSTSPASPRHADPGHSAAGHTAHAWECPSALLLRLLHLRHRRGPALGWPAAEPLLPGQRLCQVWGPRPRCMAPPT